MRWMDRVWNLSVVGAGAMILISTSGCDRRSQGAMAFPPPMVSTTKAISRDVPLYLDEIGRCAAREYVAVKPQIAGKITKIHFADGANLKKDDLLFTIDERPFKAALDQANGVLAQNKAQLALANIDFKRIKDLPRSVEPQEDYDAKASAIEVAAASVQAATAAVETAQVNLDYCAIKSPIDGRAGQRLVDIGNVVNPNIPSSGSSSSDSSSSSTLLTIQRLDPIYADFTINEDQLLSVRQEMSKGTLKTLVKLPEDADYHEGSLTFLDNSVQDGSGTIKLRATLANPDQHFWPGQFVNVRLVLEVKKDAVLVPTSVPQLSQKGSFALVIQEATGKDGLPTAQMHPVKLGQRQGDLIVIESGVQAGDEVVTDGQMLVQPGGPVKILPPAAPVPSATQPADPQGTVNHVEKGGEQ